MQLGACVNFALLNNLYPFFKLLSLLKQLVTFINCSGYIRNLSFTLKHKTSQACVRYPHQHFLSQPLLSQFRGSECWKALDCPIGRGSLARGRGRVPAFIMNEKQSCDVAQLPLPGKETGLYRVSVLIVPLNFARTKPFKMERHDGHGTSSPSLTRSVSLSTFFLRHNDQNHNDPCDVKT